MRDGIGLNIRAITMESWCSGSMYQSTILGGINCLEGKYTLSYFVYTFATYTRDAMYVIRSEYTEREVQNYGHFKNSIEEGGISRLNAVERLNRTAEVTATYTRDAIMMNSDAIGLAQWLIYGGSLIGYSIYYGIYHVTMTYWTGNCFWNVATIHLHS